MTAPTYADYLARVRTIIREVDVADLEGLLATGALLIDVREPDEQERGVIAGARLVPRGLLEGRIETLAADRTTPVALYCASGNRSALAAAALRELGYADVVSLAGGIAAWTAAGRAIVRGPGLSLAQRARYARQTILPQIGDAGQAKLLASKVLVVGAGGLGSPTALYLAAAGVGTLGIVDDDAVDRSNLQRQILHDEGSVGRPKTRSARERLERLSADVRVVTYDTRLSAANALEIMRGYDVVVDGTDNFATRYVINDACVLLGIPNVHGAIHQFDGQVSVFHHDGGPCYRCLYPEPPPEGLAPSCAEAGVIGAICGVIGSYQAVETVKVLLQIGDSLRGRILAIDLLYGHTRELRVPRDPGCPVCGDHPTITTLVDLAASCG